MRDRWSGLKRKSSESTSVPQLEVEDVEVETIKRSAEDPNMFYRVTQTRERVPSPPVPCLALPAFPALEAARQSYPTILTKMLKVLTHSLKLGPSLTGNYKDLCNNQAMLRLGFCRQVTSIPISVHLLYGFLSVNANIDIANIDIDAN